MNPEEFIQLFEPVKRRFETLVTLAHTHTAGANELEEVYWAISDLEEDLVVLKEDVTAEMEQQTLIEQGIEDVN